MKRYDSKPTALPPVAERADGGAIIFYGVERSGPSFEAVVFINNTKAGVDTPRELIHGYVGVFTVFGHGGCVGEAGHCDSAHEAPGGFDLRLPQGLPTTTKTVALDKDALTRLRGEEFTVTVVPVEPSAGGPKASEELEFESWRLAIYEP
jgi:hypothetical protein